MILRIFDSETILNIPYWHEARMQRHPKEKKMAGRAGCNWDFRFESTLPSYICIHVCIIILFFYYRIVDRGKNLCQ